VIQPPADLCHADTCGEPPALGWLRYATDAEYALLATSQLAPIDGVARVLVRGCDEHAMAPETAAFTHRADCPWPSPCSCHPADPPLARAPLVRPEPPHIPPVQPPAQLPRGRTRTG
jgi:hypothetical protein